MIINHVAIWVENIEKSKEFYMKYFNGISNKKYVNELKGFSSYFLTFENWARFEIMQKNDIKERKDEIEKIGIAHIAFSTGSRQKVKDLTENLRNNGYNVVGEPRITGDGYYESVILDCDGIKIEIVE